MIGGRRQLKGRKSGDRRVDGAQQLRGELRLDRTGLRRCEQVGAVPPGLQRVEVDLGDHDAGALATQ